MPVHWYRMNLYDRSPVDRSPFHTANNMQTSNASLAWCFCFDCFLVHFQARPVGKFSQLENL